MNAPDFDQLADLFMRLGALQSPTELHGYVTGLLAVAERPPAQLWRQQAESFINTAEALTDSDAELLEDMLVATEASLASDTMQFSPLLPEEEIDLVQRVESLGQWCQGFLTGFAAAGKQAQARQGQRQWSPETQELLQDMALISQAGMDKDQDEDEAGEQQYAELIEYLRVAVMTIHLECHATPPTAGKPAATQSTPPQGGSEWLH